MSVVIAAIVFVWAIMALCALAGQIKESEE